MSVSMTVDGREFGLQFPSSLSAASVATQFCNEQAALLNSDISTCLAPVQQFISSAITSELRKKAVQNLKDQNVVLQMKVNSVDYEVSFNPSAISLEGVGKAFCAEKGAELGLLPENMSDCVAEINSHVLTQLNSYLDRTTSASSPPSSSTKSEVAKEAKGEREKLTLPLVIGEKEFSIEFVPQEVTAQQIASQFCSEQGASLGFSDATFADCVSPVQTYLTNAIASSKKEETSAPRNFEVLLHFIDSPVYNTIKNLISR